jgi:hypothetical protein
MGKTLNYIIPSQPKGDMCLREDQNKVPHRWLPTGRSRALPGNHVGVECYCKHCGDREWGTVGRYEFVAMSENWDELR